MSRGERASVFVVLSWLSMHVCGISHGIDVWIAAAISVLCVIAALLPQSKTP